MAMPPAAIRTTVFTGDRNLQIVGCPPMTAGSAMMRANDTQPLRVHPCRYRAHAASTGSSM
jgi:hypothetical protein